MIITRLAGGLGNQMFNYAIARNYQQHTSEKIILDTRLLRELETDIEKIVQRPYALNIFKNLKAETIDDKLVKLLNSRNFFLRLKRKIFVRNTTYIIQEGMKPLECFKAKKKNIVFEGNFQSETYFKAIRNELIGDFTFPALDLLNQETQKRIFSTPNTLSIHVRRGDYHASSNKSVFTSVNLAYYRNAVDYLKKELGNESFTVFLFTDDITWAKENFKFPNLNIKFVDNNNNGVNSWKDMYLMSCCRHHIIANSSFSWWGAWLSQQEGINLAPRHWFLPRTTSYDIKHIVPASWTVIDYPLD